MLLWSMDNEDFFGKEFYRIGFGEAVDLKLLTDYKVLVLTLSEEDLEFDSGFFGVFLVFFARNHHKCAK